MKNKTKLKGSLEDNWATPECILKLIRNEFGNFHDPCPLAIKKGNEYIIEVDGSDGNWGNTT